MSLRPTLYSKGAPLLYLCASISSSNAFKKWEFITTERGLLFSGVGNLSGSFHGDPEVKNPPAHAADMVSVPEWRRSPGGGNGNPLQHSCLENSMDRGAWWATVQRVAKELDTT